MDKTYKQTLIEVRDKIIYYDKPFHIFICCIMNEVLKTSYRYDTPHLKLFKSSRHTMPDRFKEFDDPTSDVWWRDIYKHPNKYSITSKQIRIDYLNYLIKQL